MSNICLHFPLLSSDHPINNPPGNTLQRRIERQDAALRRRRRIRNRLIGFAESPNGIIRQYNYGATPAMYPFVVNEVVYVEPGNVWLCLYNLPDHSAFEKISPDGFGVQSSNFLSVSVEDMEHVLYIKYNNGYKAIPWRKNGGPVSEVVNLLTKYEKNIKFKGDKHSHPLYHWVKEKNAWWLLGLDGNKTGVKYKSEKQIQRHVDTMNKLLHNINNC